MGGKISASQVDTATEFEELRSRLAEAEETLRAMRAGEVDALVVDGPDSEPRVYTLKSAVEPYRLLIEQMAQGALTVSRDGYILYCNASFARLLDRPRERLLGARLSDYVAPRATATLDELLASRHEPGREIEMLSPDGDIVEAYVTSAPLVIEGDEMRCLVVTDLSQQELRLRHAATVEASKDLIYALDRHLNIQSWNRGAEELTGLSAAEAIGRNERDVWPPDRRGDLEQLTLRVQKEGTAASIDATRRCRDGSLADLIYTLTPLKARDGQLTGYSVVAHDITERKKAEIALRERDVRVRQLAQVVDNSPDFIGISDTSGTPIYVNEAGLQLVGTDIEQARRTPVSGYFIPEEQSFIHEVVLPSVLREGQWSGPLHFRHMQTGAAIPVLYNVFRIDDPETGEPTQFATVTRDLTKQREVEAHRELLLAELNHRVKNTLATIQALVSHTLRHSADMESFREAIVGRLFAIASAHDILFKDGDDRASLKRLVAKQVGPYAKIDGVRLRLDGPPVVLEATVAHALGLIFHELATNASKYGALRDQNGKIAIVWKDVKMPEGDFLEISWIEKDGPPVRPPKRKGFGSRLIETTLSHSLGGEAKLLYDPDGLKAMLRIPIGAGHD